MRSAVSFYTHEGRVEIFGWNFLRDDVQQDGFLGLADPFSEEMTRTLTEDGTPRTELTGIFTERDILMSIIDRGRNPASLPLSDVMVKDPEGVPADASVAWVLNIMSVGGFRHVPVVDDGGRPLGTISVKRAVHFLADKLPQAILNLPPDPGVFPAQREGG